MNACRRSAGLTKRAQVVSMLLLGCVSLAMAADKVAELNDEFLEYLGSLENDDENWMDFSAAPDSHHDAAASGAVIAKAAGASSSAASSVAAHLTGSAASRVGKADK